MSLSTPARPDSEVSSIEVDDTSEIPVVPAVPAHESTTVLHAPVSADAGEGDAVAARPVRSSALLAGAAITILGALLLGFVAQLTVVGSVQHARDQEVLYDDFRDVLAKGIIPVGQLNEEALVPEGAPIALMRIPALDLEQVVVEGTASGTTMSGPGHRRDSVFPGQAGTSVVMGRQSAFGGPFGSLDELVAGDTIAVTTGQGEQEFVVRGVRRAGDPAIPVSAGASRLTLVTADGPPYLPEGTLRVDADLTSAVQPAPARPLGSASLPGSAAPMAGDPSAWVPLVFWAQALVLAALGVVWAFLRWGRWHAWVVGVPVLAFVGLSTAEQVARLLPNLL